MQGNSNDIWLPNILDKYLARPKTPQYCDMCLASFASEHTIQKSSSINDSTVSLDNELGYLKQRCNKKRAVIRYNKTRMETDPEKYYYGLLRLYFPHTQRELRTDTNLTYEEFFMSGKIRYRNEMTCVKDIV